MNITRTERPKIALFAYSEVGYVCFEELLRAGANVVAVFTHEDDPNEEIWFRSVQALAAEQGIPARTDAKLGADAADYLRELGVELIFSFYYRAMIPSEALRVPRLGSYNMHGALLPKYRGRACVNWAVLNGETETGATLHVMTELADKGDIVDQERAAIDFEDTAHDVFLKVAEASRVIMARSLPDIEAGRAKRTPQDEAQATKFGRRWPEDGIIDWKKPAVQIYNQVRALTHPFPGAFTHINGKKCFIWRARTHDGDCDISGAVLSDDPFLIAASDGIVEVLSWQFEGEAERGCLD
ncbi:formyltransferase [Synergistales bacterium]|nr:formyltransferase [Synergistales bacterium]